MPLKRISCLATLVLATAAWTSDAVQAPRLNVLFLMADDNDLGAQIGKKGRRLSSSGAPGCPFRRTGLANGRRRTVHDQMAIRIAALHRAFAHAASKC